MNRSIPYHSVKLLKWALVTHIIGAALMLTNPEPFKVEEQQTMLAHFNAVKDLQDWKVFYELNKDNAIASGFMGRIQYLHQQLFICFIFVFSIVYLVGKTIKSVLMIIYGAIKGWYYRAKRMSQRSLKLVESTVLKNSPTKGGISDTETDTEDSE